MLLPRSSIDSPLRVGAVSYLNSKPLVRGLAQALPHSRVTLDLPSRLADDLMAGGLDVALVPIVEHFRQPGTRLISDACVACRGPVLSVKLHFRTAPAKVRRLALDEGSRTSAALARILLRKLHGVEPELEPLRMDDRLEQTDADAVLVIGDRAMQPPGRDFGESWDLGDRWCQWTELPFVFAAWIARPNLLVGMDSLARALEAVRDQGLCDLDLIAKEESTHLGLPADAAKKYLSENLHFILGPSERRGMELFAGYCRELGLLDAFPSDPPLAASSP